MVLFFVIKSSISKEAARKQRLDEIQKRLAEIEAEKPGTTALSHAKATHERMQTHSRD